MKTISASMTHAENGRLVLLPFIFLLLSPQIGAQSDSSGNNQNQYPYARFSPSMAVIIVVLIAALFFMGFFSIYIRRCSDGSGTTGSIRRALSLRRRAAAARGLDASVIETFPTFTYAEVKDHKIGKETLECAVCLNEFEEDETLRLIPKCDHVFHPECIDAWLESHVTCPVCRADLTPQPSDEPVQNPPELPVSVNSTGESTNTEVVIQVDENQNQNTENIIRPPLPPRSFSIRRPKKVFSFRKYRSHSTGHSLVQPGENIDRFTLNLPEQVKKEAMDRARSVARDGCLRRGDRPGAGEGSSRAGRSSRRIERSSEVKSDRWVFFTRGFSMRSPRVTAAAAEKASDEGGTSVKGGESNRGPVKMPSFKCLEPKTADEAGLFPDDHQSSARL